MVKRLKLPSIFKSRKTVTSWKWLPFKQLKSISFRAKDNIFKSANSALSNAVKVVATLDSPWSQSKCFSAELEESGDELVEMAVEALRSERLFFEPVDTSLITTGVSRFPFQECVEQAIKSNNPYIDFRKSMEEMVEAYGKKDWEYLEDLLAWYLKMNRKKNHVFIVEAFIDMFAGLPSSRSFCSFSCHASSSSSKSKDWLEIEESFI